ncbi:MAG: pyridoxamine 5'-phosphate oxidase family protein [Solirubrobacterales bacterium]
MSAPDPLTPEIETLLDRTAVATMATAARNGRPRQSVVYFAREGNRIFVSTEATRFKARDVERTGWASLSVRTAEPPYPSATISGPARVLTEGIGAPTAAVMQRITGAPEPPPEQSDEALAAVGRVIVELTIEKVTAATHLEHLR